jgi:hypothetical protein
MLCDSFRDIHSQLCDVSRLCRKVVVLVTSTADFHIRWKMTGISEYENRNARNSQPTITLAVSQEGAGILFRMLREAVCGG